MFYRRLGETSRFNSECFRWDLLGVITYRSFFRIRVVGTFSHVVAFFEHQIYRVTMKLEDRIRELCGQIVACQSDDESVELALQLKELLHRRIEELRHSVNGSSLSTRQPHSKHN